MAEIQRFRVVEEADQIRAELDLVANLGIAVGNVANGLMTWEAHTGVANRDYRSRRLDYRGEQLTLEQAMGVETAAAAVSDTHYLPLASRLTINSLLERYRARLPYDDAERTWLTDTYYASATRHVGLDVYFLRLEMIEADISATTGVIGSGSEQRLISGDELLHRWWSWRRECDQFTGQACYEPFREAVKALGDSTLPLNHILRCYIDQEPIINPDDWEDFDEDED